MRNLITLLSLSFLTCCQGQDKEMKIQLYSDPKIESNNLENQINQNTEPETMKITDIKKKDYFAYMRSSNTQFEVLVDDVPVFRFFGKESKSGMGMNGDIPINSGLLKSGKHNIQGKMYPKYGNTSLVSRSYLTLEFSIRESNTLNIHKLYEISPPDSHPNSDKTAIINPIEGLPYYELNTELEVQLPFNIIGWTESVDLKKEMENGNDIKSEVKSAYDKIRQIIDKKDIIGFSELIKEREALLATAFYFTKDEEKKELEEFLDLIKNPDYELAPYPAEADLHFYGYGKLVTLFTKEREGVIKLINKKDPNEEIVLDFYFHRKQKEDKLEVIL